MVIKLILTQKGIVRKSDLFAKTSVAATAWDVGQYTGTFGFKEHLHSCSNSSCDSCGQVTWLKG